MQNVHGKKAGVKSQSKGSTDPAWFDVVDLIAGIRANPTQKFFLTLVWRHRNIRKGYAWMSQESLAEEMSTDVSTVKRAFRWAKIRGIIGVRRIRTGKGKDDQYNEYWLNIDALKRLQRPTEHPAPMTGDAEGEHGASMPPAPDKHSAPVPPAPKSEHGSFGTPSTGHLEVEQGSNHDRAGGTGAPIGFEVKQVASKADIPRGAVSNEAAPAIYTPHPKLTSEKQKLVDMFTWFLRDDARDAPDKSPQESFNLFRQDANALGMDWKEIQSLWKTILKAVYPDQVVRPKLVIPKRQTIDAQTATALRELAKSRGWSTKDIRNYLKRTFKQTVVYDLTQDEHDQAKAHFATAQPPRPKYPAGTLKRSRQFWKVAYLGGHSYLKRTFGVSSPADLTDEQFRQAMAYFRPPQTDNTVSHEVRIEFVN